MGQLTNYGDMTLYELLQASRKGDEVAESLTALALDGIYEELAAEAKRLTRNRHTAKQLMDCVLEELSVALICGHVPDWWLGHLRNTSIQKAAIRRMRYIWKMRGRRSRDGT